RPPTAPLFPYTTLFRSRSTYQPYPDWISPAHPPRPGSDGQRRAEYTHRDGKCSFDVLVEEFKLTDHHALMRLAQIVHAADVSEEDRKSTRLNSSHDQIS